MSALRRDLLERKLWVVVALLAVCVVAVPVLLLKHASAGGATLPPAPPSAASTTASQTSTTQAPDNEPVKVVLARIARDPFASGVPKLSTKPASQASSSNSSSTASASSSPTTTASSSSSTEPVSMVSPSPATTTTSSSSSPSSSSTTSSQTTTGTPSSTIASVPPGTQTGQPDVPLAWTTYAVSVRYGKDLSVPVKSDVARLTPLPNIMAPEVMFMGVMAGGKSAVFALHSDLGHTGPGLCRPDHNHCSAMVLKAGQTEHLRIPTANGGHRDVVLRVVRITSSITQSRKVALAAYHRVNAAGQCELDLANPVSYDSVTGTISSVAKAACQAHPDAVPFASLVIAP